MNIYSIGYTDNAVSGSQAMTTVAAKQFTVAGTFVTFTDDAGQSVFAITTDRSPIITFTGTTS